jgi:hypothetical protein
MGGGAKFFCPLLHFGSLQHCIQTEFEIIVKYLCCCRLLPSLETTDFYDFIFEPTLTGRNLVLYLLFYVQISIRILLLLTIFPVIEIDRPLHCHGKVIVFVSHLFSRTLTLGLWD